LHSQIKLGRVGGIAIGLHYSWFIIALLIAFSLADHFHAMRPGWNEAIVWSAAVITAVLFFVTLLLHELSHSLVAKSRGLRVRAITLFALGGVSQIESEPADAKSEFWIAIVGPITSFVVGFALLGAVRVAGAPASGEPVSPIRAVLLWLGYINVALALFNMIPGFPLDGGRVLRSILWWGTHSAERATRLAAQVGQAVALALILWGLYRFFVGANYGGLWLAFIGWFLLDAARSSYLQAGLLSGLRDHRVDEIMERDCVKVGGYISARDLVENYLLHSNTRCFLVTQDHSATGLVTPDELKKVKREDWDQTSLQSIMRPLSELRSIPPEMPAVQALELMSRENQSELAVVSEGKVQGIFSRAGVFRYLQLYAGLGHS
jgi:Zn-dependent protease